MLELRIDVFEAESVLLEDGNNVAKSSVEELTEVVKCCEVVGLGVADSASEEKGSYIVGSAVTPMAPEEEEEGTPRVDDVPLRELEATAVKFRFR